MKSSSCLPPSASLWQLGRAGSIPRPRAGGSPVPSRWLRAGWDGGGGAGFPTCGGNYLPTASLPAPGAAAGQGGHLPGRASLAGCRAAVPGPGVAGGTPRRPARPHAAPAGRVRRPPPRLPANVVPSPRAATSVSGGGGGKRGHRRAAVSPLLGAAPPHPAAGLAPPPSDLGAAGSLPGLRRASRSMPGRGEAERRAPPPAPLRAHTLHTPSRRRRLCKVALPPAPARRPAAPPGPAARPRRDVPLQAAPALPLRRKPRPAPARRALLRTARGGTGGPRTAPSTRARAGTRTAAAHMRVHRPRGHGGHMRRNGRAHARPPRTYVYTLPRAYRHARPRHGHAQAPPPCTYRFTAHTGTGGHTYRRG